MPVRYYAVLAIAVLLVVGLNFFHVAPGSRTPTIEYLPDHIDYVAGDTLTRALTEARARAKNAVVLTDKSGNWVRAGLESELYTEYSATLPEGVDARAVLAENNVDLSRAYDYREEGGTFRFKINQVAAQQQASMLYEISVRVHQLQSTGDWMLDIQ